MEADGGFVEDEESIRERGAEAGGEVDAFHFAAGESAGLTVEGEVAEADFIEVAESGSDLGTDDVDGFVHGREVFHPWLEITDGGVPDVGKGFSIHAEAEGFGAEAFATAGGALGVGAVAGEKNADVHFVGFGFHPIEEAFDAVPSAALPNFLEIGAVAVFDPFLVCFAEFVPWGAGVDAALFAMAEQIALAFFAAFTLEGFDGALVDAEGGIGDGFGEVDADDSAEAAAGGAGTAWAVEGKEGGGGFDEAEARGGVGPGVAESFELLWGIDGHGGEFAFALSCRCF